MKSKLFNVVLSMFLALSIRAQSLNNDSVITNLSMPNRISKSQDLVLDVKITNYKKTIIEVPVQDNWGYVLHHSGFLAIQVQLNSNGAFVDMPVHARLDSYSGGDIDTLATSDSKDWSFNLYRTYNFMMGTYRIRVLARLSLLNPIKDVYSKWLYFSCRQDIKL